MPIEKEKNIGKYVAFSQKALRGNKPNDSKAIKILMGDEKVASLMKDSTEQAHLLKKMQEEAKGGSLTEEGLRNVFGEIIEEKSSDIRKLSVQEAKGVSKQWFGKRKGYNIMRKADNVNRDRLSALKEKMAESRKNSPVMNPRGESSTMTKSGSSSGKSVTRHSSLF